MWWGENYAASQLQEKMKSSISRTVCPPDCCLLISALTSDWWFLGSLALWNPAGYLCCRHQLQSQSAHAAQSSAALSHWIELWAGISLSYTGLQCELGSNKQRCYCYSTGLSPSRPSRRGCTSLLCSWQWLWSAPASSRRSLPLALAERAGIHLGQRETQGDIQSLNEDHQHVLGKETTCVILLRLWIIQAG